MRICITGYGSIAAVHRDALLQMDGVQIDSVVGRLLDQTREFATSCSASLATLDLGEALAQPGLDAVLITSPSQVHYEQAKAALKADKHVLLEIPMALTYGEAEKLCNLAETRGKTLMICHTERYWAATMELKRRILAHELKPLHFHVEWHFFRRENINWMGRRRSWTDNLLWHHGGHAIDQAIWLFGDAPVEARAFFGPHDNRLGIPLDVSAQMRFPSGALATFALSYNAIVPSAMQRFTLIAKEDFLVYEGGRFTDSNGVVLSEEQNEEAVPRQNEEFINAIREGREPMTSGRAILRSYRVLAQMESQV